MKTNLSIIARFAGATTRRTTKLTKLLDHARSVVLTAVTSLLAGVPIASNAQFPPPAPNPRVPVIVEISPSEATAGQTIVVRTELPSAPRSGGGLNQFGGGLQSLNPGIQIGPNLSGIPRIGIPNLSALQAPKIYFTRFRQQTLPGENVRALGNNRYSVVVPQGAHVGPLKFEPSAGNFSVSTVFFTPLGTGYTVVNLSQFDVVSILVDNIERLPGQTIPATLPSNPNVFVADVGATAGNHSMQITLGPSASQPVIIYFLDSVAASTSFNTIEVGIMAAGEYLTASPNATVSGNNITASWQTFVVNADPSLSSVNGFDFTFNTSTGAITWINWNGDRPNVVASGTVAEPANWPLNPTSVTLALRRTNGTLWTNAVVNLLNKSFVAADGFTYELQ